MFDKTKLNVFSFSELATFSGSVGFAKHLGFMVTMFLSDSKIIQVIGYSNNYSANGVFIPVTDLLKQ